MNGMEFGCDGHHLDAGMLDEKYTYTLLMSCHEHIHIHFGTSITQTHEHTRAKHMRYFCDFVFERGHVQHASR